MQNSQRATTLRRTGYRAPPMPHLRRRKQAASLTALRAQKARKAQRVIPVLPEQLAHRGSEAQREKQAHKAPQVPG